MPKINWAMKGYFLVGFLQLPVTRAAQKIVNQCTFLCAFENENSIWLIFLKNSVELMISA